MKGREVVACSHLVIPNSANGISIFSFNALPEIILASLFHIPNTYLGEFTCRKEGCGKKTNLW